MIKILRKVSSTSEDRKLINFTRETFGIYPVNINLYKKALKHRSKYDKIRENNERLEFLGDSILSSVIAVHLYKKYPYQTEGFLTEMRSKIVSRKMLNHIASDMGIMSLVDARKGVNKEFSSVCGDALEALIGAIYLDRGYKLARKVILRKILKHHIDLKQLEEEEHNYKGKLIEWAQNQRINLNYQIVSESQSPKMFKIAVFANEDMIGEGFGKSKKRAEHDAAKDALEHIQN